MKKIIPIIVSVVLVACLVISIILYNYTEVFGKKVLPVKVTSATISYKHAGVSEDIIGQEEIKVSNKDLEKLSSLLKGVKKTNDGIDDVDPLTTLIINKDYSISIGEGYGYVINGKDKTNVNIPNSLYNYIYDIINDNDSKLFKSIQFSKASIHANGARIDVSNEDNLGTIKNALNYYEVNINDEFSTYNGGYKYILKLDGDMQILLYDNGVAYISKSQDDNFNKYFIFKENLYDIVKGIYEVSVDAKKE